MKIVYLFFLLYLLGRTGHTQNVYFRAMTDEMKRNMESLSIPSLPAPFFIAYTIVDSREIRIDARDGAFFTAQATPIVYPVVRVVVGDTLFTNEYGGQYMNGAQRLLPVEHDYDEIRRILWLGTDIAYRNSTQAYMAKKNLVRQMDLDSAQLSVPDMFRLPRAVEAIGETAPAERLQDWEEYVRTLMQELDTYRELESYTLQLSGASGRVYYLTSENSRLEYPTAAFTLQIFLNTLSPGGEQMQDVLVLYGNSLRDFPDAPALKQRLASFYDNCIAAAKAPRIEENYFGPVLLEGEAVTDFFNAYLTPAFIAGKGDLGQRNVRLPEDKLGKRITVSGLNVQSLPSLQQFGAAQLWGHFAFDGDGMPPQDSLPLLSAGILKNLLNGNVPTAKIKTPNGYNRRVPGNGMAPVTAPGVLKIWGDDPAAGMKQRLIEAAKKEGIGYAYRIESLRNVNGTWRTPQIFKVYTDGREERVQSGTVHFTFSSLRRISAVSGKLQGCNTYFSGVPVSYIAPASLLIEELEMEPYEGEKEIQHVVPAPRKRKTP